MILFALLRSDTRMATVGFLHTAPTHVPTFRALVMKAGEDLVDVHVVDEALLTDARRHGVNDELQGRVEQHLRQLAAKGAQVIVCTCSTLSGVAERSAQLSVRPSFGSIGRWPNGRSRSADGLQWWSRWSPHCCPLASCYTIACGRPAATLYLSVRLAWMPGSYLRPGTYPATSDAWQLTCDWKEKDRLT